MKTIVALTKALADEGRLRIICALRGRELCACQLIALLCLAPSTVSKHMSILYQAGLVEMRKSGRWMYYCLPGEEAPPEVKDALRWVCSSLKKQPKIKQDIKNLVKRIMTMDLEDLCKLNSAACTHSRKG